MERFFKSVAAKGYLILSFMAFVYVAYRGSLLITFASIVMLGAFVEYCILTDEIENGNDDDTDNF